MAIFIRSGEPQDHGNFVVLYASPAPLSLQRFRHLDYRAAGTRAIVAQLLAEAEIHWSCP